MRILKVKSRFCFSSTSNITDNGDAINTNNNQGARIPAYSPAIYHLNPRMKLKRSVPIIIKINIGNILIKLVAAEFPGQHLLYSRFGFFLRSFLEKNL